MGLVSIGEFSRLSRLSPKALRLYDELGLLRPERVDVASGYRWYATAQLDKARLVAVLRQIGVPLAEISAMVELEPTELAQRLGTFWAATEAALAQRRALALHLVDRLHGKKSTMYEVSSREIAARRMLCNLRHAANEAEVWAFGKECIATFTARPLARVEGISGAAFLAYHGEVNDDSDGPVEWCRPIADGEPDDIVAAYPGYTLRTERAHEEAFVHLNSPGGVDHWEVISDALRTWIDDAGRQPSGSAPRVTFFAPPPRTADSVPECDFAIPLA